MNRRRFRHHASTSFVAALSARCASEVPTRGDRRTRIEQLMVRLHQKEEFTGEILVADRGHVVFEGAFGTADHGTGRPYTTDTRSCLASLSNHVPRSCDGATTRTARQSCQASLRSTRKHSSGRPRHFFAGRVFASNASCAFACASNWRRSSVSISRIASASASFFAFSTFPLPECSTLFFALERARQQTAVTMVTCARFANVDQS